MTECTVLSAEKTAALLPIKPLCNEIAQAAEDYAQGLIQSPERQVLGMNGAGLLLSMPATAADVAIHKLVNVCPDNKQLGLPTIVGMVSVYDGKTGLPKLLLDGPTVTAMRTAAVSMLAIRQLSRDKRPHFAIFGSGKQASAHLAAIAQLYPGAAVDMHGRERETVTAFIAEHENLDLHLRVGSAQVADSVSVVITLTTSSTPVYSLAARSDRLLVGVGAFTAQMAEFSPLAVNGSQLYVDDPNGARHEAGDLIQAGVDWSQVQPLASALRGDIDFSRPILFKSVGSAAWDLAAARCALKMAF